MTAEQLIELIQMTKISHSFMVRTLIAQQEAMDNQNYSDDLKHSIAVEEILREVEV